MCAATPRFSQRITEDDWPPGLTLDGGDRAYWSDRACGVAALRSVLHYHRREGDSLFEVLRAGVEADGYGPLGWWHAGLVHLAAERGVPSVTALVRGLDELRDCLTATESPLLASITLGFPDDGRQGGHLVAVSAIAADGSVCVRDPSSWGECHQRVAGDRFLASFTGRVILFGGVLALPRLAG